jgi:cytochrome c biogenesis protein CcmG, thiol:disulfide interchange protein DsbE
MPFTALRLCLVLLLVAAGCTADQPGGPPDAAPQRAAPDGPGVPERSFTMFSGEEASFTTTYAGQPLLVNFWASWCAPCIEEMPDLERIHQDLGDQITLVGLNLQDDRASADRMVERTGVTYDLAEDPRGELFADFGAFTMPMTFFVDPSGVVVGRHGGLATEQQLRDLVAEHLLD